MLINNIDAVKLESKRLLYEKLDTNYISHKYVDWMNDEEVIKNIESGGNYTIEKLRKYLREQEINQILYWAIKIKKNNKHIGNIKIDPINYEARSGVYGIMIGDKNEWSKGYATEASKKILDYCFQKIGLEKITLGVKKENIIGLKLYNKLGFKKFKDLNELKKHFDIDHKDIKMYINKH